MHRHSHQDSPPNSPRATTTRVLAWALALNLSFLILEAGVGLVTGSLALLSDAAHMIADVAALALALGVTVGVARFGSRLAPGRGRWIEALGGAINAAAMVVIVGLIVREAVARLASGGPEVAPWPVLVVGLAGMGINLACAWWLARGDRENLNVRGALLHMLGDALGSLGAVLAAVGLMLGFRAADAVVSLAIAALVLVATLGLLRDTFRVLRHGPGPCSNTECALCEVAS